jgi:hypothetical protein
MTGSTVRARLPLAVGAGIIGALLSACNGSGSSETGSAAQAVALGEARARLIESLGMPARGSETSGFIVRSWGSPLVDPAAGHLEPPGSGSASPSGSAPGSGASGANFGGATKTSGSVTIAWDPPTENTNGTALTNLAGFNIHYGTQSENYTNTIQITNPGVTRYVVENLPAGTYYFAVTAYTTVGEDSAYSPQVSATIE